MKFLPVLLLSTALASPALALDQCRQTPTDQNVRVCDYHQEQRYVVTAVVGYPVNLQLGPRGAHQALRTGLHRAR